MRTVVLREEDLESAKDAHEYLARKLHFPAYYGANLSALSDCLEDVDTPTRIVFEYEDEYERPFWMKRMEAVTARCCMENTFLSMRVHYPTSIETVHVALTPAQAKQRLVHGNETFIDADTNLADISDKRVFELFEKGQHPFATIITCADSRVVPEHVFMAGLGELFSVRVAGNVAGQTVAASVAYAVEHLHTPLVVVLGHTECGAVAAALSGDAHGSVTSITDDIAHAIGNESDAREASMLNAKKQAQALAALPELSVLEEEGKVEVVAALYDTKTGHVDFL